MATKKKTKKKQPRTNRTAGKRVTPANKEVKKKLAKKVKKKLAKNEKKAPQKKAAVTTKALAKEAIGGKKPAAAKKKVGPAQNKRRNLDAAALFSKRPVSRSTGQSGDLQGLSNLEGADSESVTELLEEGNAFEADAVMGVEQAGSTEGREVYTHEMPEDDVPGEYLDEE